MNISIEYCAVWNYLPKASSLEAELKEKFSDSTVTLIPSGGGVFEISVDDFNDQNNLFTYISTSWTISGDKNDVLEVNQDRINTLPNGLKRILFPLQLWRPSPDSSDSLEKKLERLRK